MNLIKCMYFIGVLLLSILIPFIFVSTGIVRGVELFSKDEEPFGKSYDDWIAEFWNWVVSLSPDEADPKQGGCLTHESGSMVMLMNSAVGGSRDQVCNISANQGILIPVWNAFCDSGAHRGLSDEQLTKCAREKFNLGKIGSDVKVDGVSIANLDVTMKLVSGSLDYKITTLQNISEIYAKGFNFSIPADSHLLGPAKLVAGDWRAGSHGWWVFLEPLPPGSHTVSYNVRVFPTEGVTSPGVTTLVSDISYLLNVT
jgi:hypothetical protein